MMSRLRFLKPSGQSLSHLRVMKPLHRISGKTLQRQFKTISVWFLSLKIAFSSSGFLPFCRLFSMSGTAARQRRKTLLGSIILMPNSITSRRLLSRHLSLKMGQSTCLRTAFSRVLSRRFTHEKRTPIDSQQCLYGSHHKRHL